MATWLGLSMGITFLVAGWSLYVFAPKVGPNPIFGIRTWYSMVNVDVWNESNRTGGILLAGTGALMVFASVAIRPWIDPDSDAGILAVVGVELVLTAISVTWLVLYTRRLAKGVPITGAGYIRVSPLWLAPAAALTLGLLAFLVATNSNLPDQVATHFDVQGAANGRMSPSSHLWFSGATVSGLFVLLGGLFVVLTRVRIPGAETWPIAGEPVLHFLAAMLFVVEGVMGAAFLDIYWFNTRQEHLISTGAFTFLVLCVVFVGVAAGIAYMVIYGRRLKQQRFADETM